MVWTGKNFKISSNPAPGYGQGHLSLDQIAQSPIKPDIEYFQGWNIHSFSVAPNMRYL